MAVINAKERAPGPVGSIFELRLNYIKDNGDSIFIIVSNDALVGISCVGNYYSVSFACEFGGFICREEVDCGIELELIR